MVVPGAERPKDMDGDGRQKRTGTMWTASAHIVAVAIGSGVLSLPWAFAQLGWVLGPAVVLIFASIICYTSWLLTDCYRFGDQSYGERTYTYMDAVKANLGAIKVRICELSLYSNMVGVAIGYTVAASMSMLAIQRANCFHHKARQCNFSSWPYMVTFGVAEIFFSQIPAYKMWWLSFLVPAMSFIYTFIGVGLSIAKVIENRGIKGSLTGITMAMGAVTPMGKVWSCLQAFGDIAFAYSYSVILIEIQDTIKAPPPPESKVMKRAITFSVTVTTLFYIVFGFIGYAALGDATPGNLLAGLGLYEPYWLLDVANVAVVIHLAGAYQIYCRPIFAFVEKCAARMWPHSVYITREFEVRSYKLNLFRVTWRTAFVVATTVVSMLLPFFHDVVALVGALGFWPLSVYIPVEMYVRQKKVPRWSTMWVCLQVLSLGCLFISLAATAGSIAGIASDKKE